MYSLYSFDICWQLAYLYVKENQVQSVCLCLHLGKGEECICIPA